MPRKPDKADMIALGHVRRPLLQTIRAKCLDCCVGNAAEVARCTVDTCSLFPYRFGTNPFSTRAGNPEALAKARASKRKTEPSPNQEGETQ